LKTISSDVNNVNTLGYSVPTIWLHCSNRD